MVGVALLHPVDGKHTGKTFGIDDNGQIIERSYQSGSYFRLERLQVDGIASLAELLNSEENTQSTLVIRGLPHQDTDLSRSVRRRLHRPHDTGSDTNAHPFLDLPQPWLMIDVDKHPLPNDIDLVGDTQAAVDFVVQQLPEEFQAVSYCWQLSGSAGVFGTSTISVHLWFWLTEAFSSYDLRQWSKDVNVMSGKKLIDPTLYNAVQPHYITNPKFVAPLQDLVSQRFGFVEKDLPAVSLNMDLQVPKSDSLSEASASGPQSLHSETRGYENILAELGDHPGGDGFYHPLLRATASLVREKGEDWILANIDGVIADLQRRIDEAEKYDTPQRYESIQHYRSWNYLRNLFLGAVAKGYGSHVNAVPPQFPSAPDELNEAAKKVVLQALEAFKRLEADTEGRYTAVIRAPAGIGKTTFISRMLATMGDRLAGRFVEYYVPNHTLSEQVESDLKEVFSEVYEKPKLGDHPEPVQVNVIRGYDYRDDDGNDFCLKRAAAKKLTDAGLSVSYFLCGDAKAHCEYYDVCPYRQQFTGMQQLNEGLNFQLPIVNVLAHNHLFLQRRNDLPKPSLVIVDESFYQVGIKEHLVNPAELRQIKNEIARSIHYALVDGGPLLKTLRDQNIDPFDLYAEAEKHRAPKPDISPLTNSEVQAKKLDGLPKPSHIDKLLFVLAEELQFTDRDDSYSVEYNFNQTTKEEFIKVQTRQPLTIPGDVPLLVIDADANMKIIETFRPIDHFFSVVNGN